MKITGKIDVFQTKNGYDKGIIVAFKDGKVESKTFIDVILPEDIETKEGQTLTLDVKEGYLNAVFVNAKDAFTKLQISVVKASIVKVFPEEKEVKKPSKKVSK